MQIKYRLFLYSFFLLISISSNLFANSEWVSIKEEGHLQGVWLIFTFNQKTLIVKELKTLVESPIINKETQYHKQEINLFLNQKDSIKITSIKENKELFIFHHKYGELRLVPFKRYKQSTHTKEIKKLLRSNILKMRYLGQETYFDINRDSISVDPSRSIFGQLYYIEEYHEEVFLILTRMFGPVLHIKEISKSEITTIMYSGSIPQEIKLQLLPESNQEYRDQIEGLWVSSSVNEGYNTQADCQIKRDTIKFIDNKCFFNHSCYYAKGLWDVCHNGKYIAFRVFDKKYNQYQMPDKLDFKLLDSETLEMGNSV